MAANQYGIDLGSVLTQAATIKEAKAKSDVLQRRNELSKQVAGEGTLDSGAIRAWAALDPEGFQGFAAGMKTWSDAQKQQADKNVETMGLAALRVRNAPDEQKESTYQYIRSQFGSDVQQGMPEKYDPNWVDWQYTRAVGMMQMIENPEVLTVGGYDQMYKNGEAVGNRTPNVNMLKMTNDNQQKELDRQNTRGNALIRSNGGSGSGKVTAASLGELRRLSENAVGGIETIDQDTGKSTVSQGKADQANWVATRAEWYVGQGVPMFQAVNRAKQDMQKALEREGKAGTRKSGAAQRPSAKGIF